MPTDIVLRNSVGEVGISRADALIVSWTERATGIELLRAPMGLHFEHLSPDPGGFLATVEETDDGHEALLYDPFGHDDLSVQIRYRLPEGVMALDIEIAITNRAANARREAFRWSGSTQQLIGDEVGINGPVVWNGRQSVELAFRASPYPSFGGEIGWEGDALTVRVVEPVVGARLFLGTASGETHEASVSCYPERALTLPLAGLAPTQALLRAGDGRTLIQVPREEPETDSGQLDNPPRSLSWREQSDRDLGRLSRDWNSRHLALLELARRATRADHLDEADGYLESALLYNADDPLLWWQKAAVRRHLDPEGERAEWLNARFLRPLEPLVAAEAILSQEESPSDNPLMAVVAGRESHATACVLAYEAAGLIGDATTLGHRILAAKGWPRVAGLLAGLYLETGRLDAEAARLWSQSRSEYAYEPREQEMRARLTERFGPA